MTEIPKMALSALRLSQDRRAQARDELEMAMRGHWNELSGIQPKDRTSVGRQFLIELLGAYASKIFEIGAGELVDRKLAPIDLGKRLDELESVVQAHLIPPQFDFRSGFCLSELEYDEAYRSHVKAVLEDCVRSWKKKRHVAETEEAGACTVADEFHEVRFRKPRQMHFAADAEKSAKAHDQRAPLLAAATCEGGFSYLARGTSIRRGAAHQIDASKVRRRPVLRHVSDPGCH